MAEEITVPRVPSTDTMAEFLKNVPKVMLPLPFQPSG